MPRTENFRVMLGSNIELWINSAEYMTSTFAYIPIKVHLWVIVKARIGREGQSLVCPIVAKPIVPISSFKFSFRVQITSGTQQTRKTVRITSDERN